MAKENISRNNLENLMQKPKLNLNALRAFEAAARHASLTKAAAELHVTPGALSHLVRGLEAQFGVALFERGVRSIALSEDGRALYPGLRAAFIQIGDAVDTIRQRQGGRTLVASTPPGFTAKWLAPRLYRFSLAHPDLDVRVSSSASLADFRADGIDLAVRMIPCPTMPTRQLAADHLIGVRALPVCSPRLLQKRHVRAPVDLLETAPLIHDESWSALPTWAHWAEKAGVSLSDASRGLRFTSADHALDAVGEGAGVLLTLDVLAYDDLRSGRLIAPFGPALETGGAYHVVSLSSRRDQPSIRAFREWIMQEMSSLDWSQCPIPTPPDTVRRRRKTARPAR